MFEKLDNLLKKLNEYRPLIKGEIKRLRDEFLIDFTYNSNAMEGNTLTLQETALVYRVEEIYARSNSHNHSV